MRLMNGRYGVIDLASGESSDHEVPDDSFGSPSSYLSFIESAAQRQGGDPLTISSGLLTCSFVPAACAGFVLSPRAGAVESRLCPLTGYIGTELKLSGFDFVILSGKADEPGYVWIRDGIIEFVPSADIAAVDSWERTDAIRKDQGDRKIQVISTGPWGDACMPSSQLVMNYWGGEDRIGCAADFGAKSLSALALRGMGELEVDDADEHFARSMKLRSDHLTALGESSGLSSFTDKASGDDFGKLFHRKVACYGCPFPCRSYYKVFEDASVMALQNDEPGYLVYDIPGFESMLGLGLAPRDVVTSLMMCARSGADPVSVAASAGSSGEPVSAESIKSLLSSRTAVDDHAGPLKGSFGDAFQEASDYVTCLALGLCPRYWARAGLDVEAITLAAEPATGSKMVVP